MDWVKFNLKGLGSSQNSQVDFQLVEDFIEKDHCYFQINWERMLDWEGLHYF
jgi:hypothetical protein